MRRLLVLTVLIAGCGDDSNRHIIDAPIVYPDGPNADAPPAPVTLTVTSSGTVVPNVKVYFQDADSHVVSATTTDTTGAASAVMGPGGFVTALNPFAAPAFGGPSDELFTFAGVKPGDHLVLDTPVYAPFLVNVTLPASTGPGVVQYTVSTSCSFDPGNDFLRVTPVGSGAPLGGSLEVYDTCPAVDVVIAAEDRDGHPVQYIYLAAQTFTAQQTVDWSALTYTDAVTTDFTYSNLPAGAFNFQLADRILTGHGLAYDAFNGVPTIGTTTTETLALPTFAGAAGAVDADLQTNPNTAHHFFDWGAYNPTFTTDVGARMVHEFNAFPGQSTTAPNTMTWSETTAGVDPDWILMRIYAARTADAHTWGWSYVGPHAAGAFTLPNLPVDVYDYNIATNDNATPNQMLMLKTPGGYDAARAHAFELDTFGPQTLIVGASGTATVAEATQTTLNTRTKRPQAWQHFNSAVHVLRNRY